ncbi:MAG TPA: HAD-IB family phosphatase [Gemmatimonadaceae bacterium]|nr:HAD-IB family phosphatase [Gemmatimonadaceae bacterium]
MAFLPKGDVRFRCVIFDCDSTLCAIEGIQVLGAAHQDEIARLTESAMHGRIPLEDVYARRLALARPSRRDLDALAEQYIAALVPDARDVVSVLVAAGIDVRIVSGGLRPAVLAVARALGVSEERVSAVDVRFDGGGAYSGFDAESPLARSGGKRDVIEAWTPAVPRPAMLVGDGATDLEARPAVDAFVAFAGVVRRKDVVDRADLVIDGPSLAPVVPLALGSAPPSSALARAVFDRGVTLLAGRSLDGSPT